MRQRLVTYSVVLGAVAFLVPGVWAFCWPENFHRNVALYDPFNLHLFHDVGAFQLGIGIALLAALFLRDALAVVLLGAASGALVHLASHVMDRDLGGRSSDPYALGAVALVLVAAFVLRLSLIRRQAVVRG